MASVEVVAIGTEILLGDLVDTNSAHIARRLADSGVDVYQKHAVGDNAARLEAMLRGALDRADGVITTGGLGPTVERSYEGRGGPGRRRRARARRAFATRHRGTAALVRSQWAALGE